MKKLWIAILTGLFTILSSLSTFASLSRW